VKLTLSLRTSPPPEGVEAQHVLEQGSMTIGRASEATWTIPNPTRIISKQHCRIDAAPGGFTITDISTNGVFVNEQPIGSQSTRRLAHGDLIRLGDIVIAVGIEGADQVAPDSASVKDGPFGENEPRPVPGPAIVEPLPAAGVSIAEDWWKEAPAARTDSVAAPFVAGSQSPVADAIVVSLIESFPELDVTALAQGVDVAGAVVSDREWQAFHDRLRSYLRERYPENA
jgi:type VI secretion system FHA domain protein